MYQELVKRLRDSEHETDCSLCDRDCCYPDGKVHGKCIIIEAADAIEELTRENKSLAKSVNEASEILRRRWISVTERLPEDLARVIVFCNDGVFFGFCEHLIVDGEEVVEWNDFLHYPITPTHWMPIPEPPKER